MTDVNAGHVWRQYDQDVACKNCGVEFWMRSSLQPCPSIPENGEAGWHNGQAAKREAT